MEYDKMNCNRNQLAEALDVSHKHIDNLHDAGIVVKLGRGSYDLITSCKNYIEFVRGSQSAEKLDLTQERTRLTKYQADLAHIQLKQAQGEYLPLTFFASFVKRMVVTIRSKMLSLPSTIAVEFPGIEKEALVRISDLICETLFEAGKTPVPRELDGEFKKHMQNIGAENEEETSSARLS